jgi:Grx4 family monothiol glutaredoxin
VLAAASAPPAPPQQQQAQPLEQRLGALVHSAPVVLFMKGSPDAPKCGFSRKVVEALRAAGCATIAHFDILTDPEVREGMKAFSEWPTYPQLYANGELLGGCDIVLAMAAGGELAAALAARPSGAANAAVEAAAATAARRPEPEQPLDDRLRALLASSDVLLFMKGSPEAPKCGFSRKVVEAVQGTGVAFRTFDILEDSKVREGLKAFSQWPTYPQLYARGELLGGCDIVLAMAESGELKTVLGRSLVCNHGKAAGHASCGTR